MPAAAKIAVLSGVSIGLGTLVFRIASRRRSTPEKREQQRRLQVHLNGRLGDGMVTEVAENALYYSYTVHGVQYTASQDITTLRERLPADPECLIGVTSLKYSPKNPANSILICEEWSGLRAARSRAAE
jgi:hypothetical protein